MCSAHILSINSVAPHVGAWIETRSWSHSAFAVLSLPMWERGLKQDASLLHLSLTASLPMWERGLKLVLVDMDDSIRGRSPCGSVD